MTDAVHRSRVFGRITGRPERTIARGAGAMLWDNEGRRYLDASGGAVVVNIGHGRSEMALAMAAQASDVAYVHASHFTSQVLEEYAARLAPHTPGSCDRLYLVSGGSEANETAVKLARAYHVATGSPRRHKIVRGSTSYHGGTLATLSLSGRPTLRAPFLPMLQDTPAVASPFCYHCVLDRTFPSCEVACADDLARVIEREGPDTVAAFILEPIIGASAGAAVPPEDYVRRARATCAQFNVLFIADEVMTGFGRTGRWFGIDWSGVSPDIVTCGKGMSGGYMPVGAVLTTSHIVQTVNDAGGFAHGFTFSHNPVTAAASLMALRILEDERLVERADVLGRSMHERLRGLAAHPHVGDVRGRGLMAGIELVADKASRRPFPRSEKRAERLAAAAFDNGLLIYPSGGCADGLNGDIVMIAPPFVVGEDELDEIVDLLDRALTQSGL